MKGLWVFQDRATPVGVLLQSPSRRPARARQVGKAHLALGRAYQSAGPELSDKAEAALQRACDVCAQLRAAHRPGDAAGVRPAAVDPEPLKAQFVEQEHAHGHSAHLLRQPAGFPAPHLVRHAVQGAGACAWRLRASLAAGPLPP